MNLLKKERMERIETSKKLLDSRIPIESKKFLATISMNFGCELEKAREYLKIIMEFYGDYEIIDGEGFKRETNK